MKSKLPTLLLLIMGLWQTQFAADSLYLDCYGFVMRGLSHEPRLMERNLERAKGLLKIREVDANAFLPRFELNMIWGPSPGFRESLSRHYIGNDTVLRVTEKFDFNKMGPYFGTEIKAIQPLNVSLYQSSKRAATAYHQVLEGDWQKERVRVSKELQGIYYGYMTARQLNSLAKEADRELRKARSRIEDLLDDDDPSVSQIDLLELRVRAFEVTEGLAESEQMMDKAYRGAIFSLGLQVNDHFEPKDSILLQRTEVLPPWEELLAQLRKKHPDLKRLNHGLEARRQMILARAEEMGPLFFLFGSFQYARSWAGDRRGSGFNNALVKDPVNRMDGALGIGVRLNLNFWEKNISLEKEKIELSVLEQTKNYALHGLEVQLRESYQEHQRATRVLDAARDALRASDAWLKGAAMSYDFDPSQSAALIRAYTVNLEIRKKYYMAIYAYNLSIADVLSSVGWTLPEYYSIYSDRENPKE
jgi:outer membrane protein TolC